MTKVTIITDADACIPITLCRKFGILTAPLDPPLLINAEPAASLRRDQAPLKYDTAVATALHASATSTIIVYVSCDDGYGGGKDLVSAAHEALIHQQSTAKLVSVPITGTLMAVGWAAIAAGNIAQTAPETDLAIAKAKQIGESARVLALLEYPQIAGIGGGLASTLQRTRAIVELRGSEIEVLEQPSSRAAGLRSLRERFVADVAGVSGALHVAIHHAGAAPAATAMQRWVNRELEPAESVLAPLTRHAATRLGPGLVGFAWYTNPPN